jgi:hypothetical protein
MENNTSNASQSGKNTISVTKSTLESTQINNSSIRQKRLQLDLNFSQATQDPAEKKLKTDSIAAP